MILRRKKNEDFKKQIIVTELKQLWLHLAEILAILNEIFLNQYELASGIIESIQPLLEQFFMVYYKL